MASPARRRAPAAGADAREGKGQNEGWRPVRKASPAGVTPPPPMVSSRLANPAAALNRAVSRMKPDPGAQRVGQRSDYAPWYCTGWPAIKELLAFQEAVMVEFSHPAAYELWMGRWSRRLAPSVVSFADLASGSRLLDVGSGTGILFGTRSWRSPQATWLAWRPRTAWLSTTQTTVQCETFGGKQGSSRSRRRDSESI